MNKKKIITLSVIVVSLVILLAGGTYAWYVWSNASEDDVQVLAGLDAATVVYTGGSNITGVRLKPTETKEEGIVKSIKIYSKDEVYYTLNFDLYLDILSLPEGLKDTSFKYSFYKGDTFIKGGSFTQEYLDSNLVTCTTNSTNHIVLLTDEEITSTKTEYILYIWIDGNLPNPDTMQELDFSFKLHATGENAVVKELLVQHIVGLYTGASKTEVDAADGITYNYATSVGLMNDRLGTMKVGIDQGNIRYYGANPNNYIDIGDVYEEDTVVNHYEENAWIINQLGITSQDMCLSYANCPTLIAMNFFEDEDSCKLGLTTMYGTTDANGICGTETIPAGTTKSLYRIIGVFKNVELADGSRKDLIKVMRNDTIGMYSWDQSVSTINDGRGVNEWNQADLMKLLNPGYGSETVGGSLYWNSDSGTCYGYDGGYKAIPCDFTNKGLSTSVQGKIETVKWNLGGWNSSSVYSNQIYEYERQGNVVIPGTTCSGSYCNDGITRKTEWPGEVALAYPSDYGYAVDLRSCSSQLNYYENCTGTNWMYPRMTFGGISSSWLLTPSSVSASYSWLVAADGGVYNGNGVYSNSRVSPVFYLNSELVIESGDGSSGNPYRLS